MTDTPADETNPDEPESAAGADEKAVNKEDETMNGSPSGCPGEKAEQAHGSGATGAH